MNPTLKYAVIYGLLSGIAIVGVIVAGMIFGDNLEFTHSLTFGYSVMVVGLSFVFVGVKRYRDVERGGVIRFWPALGVGLAIAGIATLAYAMVWEAYLAATHYAFIEDFTAGALRDARASGKSAAEIARMTAEFDALRVQYGNPFFRVPMTMMEIAPVALLVPLVSAALLRNPKVLPARG